MFKLPDGRHIAPGNPFTHGGVQYPANWVQLSAPWQKDAIGLVKIIEQPRPDERFYWVSQNEDGSWTKTPKNLDQLKAMQIAQIKQTAGSMLTATDYQVIREAEGGKATSQATKNWRAAVRAYSNQAEAEINALTSVDDLVAWASTPREWPVDPNAPARN